MKWFIDILKWLFIDCIRYFASGDNAMKQTTFCYCPNCKNEICSDGSLVDDDGEFVLYQCKQCGTKSRWLFDCIAPVLLSYGEENGSKDPRPC